MAIVLAYLIGMLVAFMLMRGFVFNAQDKSAASQTPAFIVVNLLAVLQTLLVSVALARWVLPYMDIHQHVEGIAHFVGVVVPVFTSYLGHRHATFK